MSTPEPADLQPGERMARGKPRVVVVGAGFAGLTLARRLGSLPVEVTLIDRNNFHLFTPLVYQVASAQLSAADVAQPVRSQLRSTRNARFLKALVTDLDLQRRLVLTEHGDVAYDYLVLAPGSVNNDFGNESVRRLSHSLKDLPEALDIRNAVMGAFERWSWERDPKRRKVMMTFAIVGGGPAGVEYAGALSELLRTVLRKDFRTARADTSVVLLEGGGRILTMFDPSLAASAADSLTKKGVVVRTNTLVKGLRPGAVELTDGSVIEAGTVVWAAGVRASDLGRLLGVELDQLGRVPVTATLQVQGLPEVFVVGDLASRDGLPMLARPAIQEGKHVARAIQALLLDRPPPRFRYHDPGIMAVVGRGSAIAEIQGFRFHGLTGWLLWLLVHIVLITTFRSRIAALLNWAWAYLLREPPVRLEVRATPQAESQETG